MFTPTKDVKRETPPEKQSRILGLPIRKTNEINELYNEVINELHPKARENGNTKISFGDPQKINIPGPTQMQYEYFIDTESHSIGRKLIADFGERKGLQETGIVEYFETMESRGDKKRFLDGVKKALDECKRATRTAHDESFD